MLTNTFKRTTIFRTLSLIDKRLVLWSFTHRFCDTSFDNDLTNIKRAQAAL